MAGTYLNIVSGWENVYILAAALEHCGVMKHLSQYCNAVQDVQTWESFLGFLSWHKFTLPYMT